VVVKQYILLTQTTVQVPCWADY